MFFQDQLWFFSPFLRNSYEQIKIIKNIILSYIDQNFRKEM
ncbi:hypothetical protein LEP1GSC062_2558 [Leptospira alexanderi serovar Manhao 3 str. L 60]|uniref:Uncharacterized protein n=1 Tax=Leptospira alexanderi serovar Manhao 3 str. L 60 TaxID=1049759 RepID=V6IFP0_9LEPT|nr:hypothetical protein LEP1GSC062_2558 [Leptospira alexanderi serovar Manhao 3 str. L 60]